MGILRVVHLVHKVSWLRRAQKVNAGIRAVVASFLGTRLLCAPMPQLCLEQLWGALSRGCRFLETPD